MKFLNAADIHLGYRQYNNSQRYRDFSDSFQKIVDCAINEQVKVCLIADDLFHHASIDPHTLLQAEHSLQQLQDHNIEVIVISGNHDRSRYGHSKTWLDYLAARKLIMLLESFTDGIFLVRDQSYVDLDGIRFIGMPWYSGSTRLVLEKIAEELPHLAWLDIRYTVLMAHTGIVREHTLQQRGIIILVVSRHKHANAIVLCHMLVGGNETNLTSLSSERMDQC